MFSFSPSKAWHKIFYLRCYSHKMQLVSVARITARCLLTVIFHSAQPLQCRCSFSASALATCSWFCRDVSHRVKVSKMRNRPKELIYVGLVHIYKLWWRSLPKVVIIPNINHKVKQPKVLWSFQIKSRGNLSLTRN